MNNEMACSSSRDVLYVALKISCHVKTVVVLPARRAQHARLVLQLLSDFVFVWLSVRAKSKEAWEQLNGDSWHVWLFQVSWFVRLLAAKGSVTVPVLSAVALVTQVQYRESSPRSMGTARLRQTTQGQKLQWCYSTLCPISEFMIK